MPDTVLSILRVLTYVILTIPLLGGASYHHFTDEEAEAQTSNFPKGPQQLRVGTRIKFRPAGC